MISSKINDSWFVYLVRDQRKYAFWPKFLLHSAAIFFEYLNSANFGKITVAPPHKKEQEVSNNNYLKIFDRLNLFIIKKVIGSV